jgi:hypothetical protein
VDYSQTLSAIEIHARRSRTRAVEARREADQIEADARDFVAKMHGPAMEPHRQTVLANASQKAAAKRQEALDHDARGRTGEAGYCLHRPGVEARNPHYAMEHQELVAAASKHGLLRSEPV